MTDDKEDEKVKVFVRVRPFNKREKDLNTECVVSMKEQQTLLRHPKNEKPLKTFAFDCCLNSIDRSDDEFADQVVVFENVGLGVLDNAFDGYNACIFAYGQTGSGKSYTMMGTTNECGIIPRLCHEMFDRIEKLSSLSLIFKVEVSYLEIYNEKVRDLLDPKKSNRNLKVREHKVLGPMVDGLSVLAVSSYEQIVSLMEEGNKSRTVAATNMNTESSRSHAVFNIRLTQTINNLDTDFTGEKVSKISLVDLAGSERAQKSGAVGKRLEEGANINKSLTTLGMVISALAEQSHLNALTKRKFIPYRDAVLTWLLKGNLGGNSRTVMIATISPSADNYEETLSTLRYADRAKKIVNHAVINEDPNAKMIRELREEVEVLRARISNTVKEQNENEELRERLAESERLVEMMNKSWDERLRDTDAIYKQRQKDLEDIGISVAGSGIKVEKDRFYLVNLNADPSLNELLVYYINHRAVIGSDEQDDYSSGEKVDFVLQGLGVLPRHALLDVVEEEDHQNRLYIEKLDENASICVNGQFISERTLLRNGNRLLIGNNHFFRVNCPKEPIRMDVSTMDEAGSMLFDYQDAWQEVNCCVDANPISTAVDQYMEEINRKHEEEKQAALEEQYEEFQRYIYELASQGFTPSTPMTSGIGHITPNATPSNHFPSIAFPVHPKTSMRSRFFKWAHKRNENFKENLARLKTEIIRASALVREANMITKELSKNCRRPITYDLTLQIPAANLRPSKIMGGSFVCEPFVVVKRAGIDGSQLWSILQLEDKLIDMREMFSEKSIRDDSASGFSSEENDKFAISLEDNFNENFIHSVPTFDNVFESQENHSLVGVVNVFLEVLFHDLKLDYQVPIISQQGEVSGRLHVEIQRLSGEEEVNDMSSSTDLAQSSKSNDSHCIGIEFLGKIIKCRVRIKKASNLPSSLSHFVFCQYSFFNISETLVVAPIFNPSPASSDLLDKKEPSYSNFRFDHEQVFDVKVTEEFLEYVQEDALSIEVWGHRSSGFDNDFVPLNVSNKVMADARRSYESLKERWAEVTRRVELKVDIMEMNDNGEYVSVDVYPAKGILTGGVYQLKHGLQRRLSVKIFQSFEHGSLPLAFAQINSVSVGCICSRDPVAQKPLDSYQEFDLEVIRDRWTRALVNRQQYLMTHINELLAKSAGKTESEVEREQSLINQWVSLTEERNAVSVPVANSDIPGSPAEWTPPPGFERHVPVLFLDLNSDDITEEVVSEDGYVRVAGDQTVLSRECCSNMVVLPILERDPNVLSAICSWDSSIHHHQALNRPSDGCEYVYAIVKVSARLVHPCEIDIIFRKRICMHVYNKTSFTERLYKKFVSSASISVGTSVYYDIVAHIPKSTSEVEDRTSLARLAAHQSLTSDDDQSKNFDCNEQPETYIEAYTKSIQAVESMLKLDRLRQEFAISSTLTRQERLNRLNHFTTSTPNYRMKRAASLPNTNLKPSALKSKINPAMQSSHCSAELPVSSSSSSLSTSSFMAPNLISPMLESAKLSGIDEEQMFTVQCAERAVVGSYFTELCRLRALQIDGSETLRNQAISIESLSVAALSHSACSVAGCMMSLSASDSGCMMESCSSSATTNDDEHKILTSGGDGAINTNQESSKLAQKSVCSPVKTGVSIDLNSSRL